MAEQRDSEKNVATLDLSNPPTGQKRQIALASDEHKVDRQVRVIREIVMIVGVVIVGAVLVYSWETLHDKTAQPDAQKCAFGTLSAIGSGAVITYLFKK